MLKRYLKTSRASVYPACGFDDQEEVHQVSLVVGCNEYGISAKSEFLGKYASAWGAEAPRRARTVPCEVINLIESVERVSAPHNFDVDHEPIDRSLLTRDIFKELAQRWYQETMLTSSGHDLILHPAYQRIIGLGPDVIPFVLEELRDNGGHWFWALQSLTGENPVQEIDVGRYKKMREAWLTWGANKSYI